MELNQDETPRQSTDSGGETDHDYAVRIENVTKEYDDVVAVDDVSLNIRDEEFLTLLGPSGAGKTTLLHMIAGFTTPTSGDIHIDDEVVTNKPPYERNIGMVFQSMALFPHMTVAENIAFPLKMRRMEKVNRDERVQEMLDLIRLPEIADRDVSELSGGQQQRVAIARALSFKPSLLLLDEPLSSLDKKLREEMRHELLRIHRETNVTTVHVTHNQEEALTMADRMAVIQEGRIAQHAPTQELYAHPETAFVADFVGNTNMVYGTVVETDNPSCTVECTDSNLRIDCRTDVVGESVAEKDDVSVGIRFEDVRLGESISADNVFEATVSSVVFKGDMVNTTVQLDGTELEFKISDLNSDGNRVFERGDVVQVGWNGTDSLVYPS
ncbi:ABC transporter ATP-binding protein [Natrarchaeobius oligotrophus]|uniref:Molybdate/tungstate import ATP-binding protein WtpC n=1 Tax=Natrarchaeobius chitinivorans TaxID=1679083 RepID=A0A3N6MH94_NATCH|nr:ABC transporter ATP-binding protein [Natrarchaeobius chitinivorans]RQH02468.1 ABC transporter ATP-binding protein [Natrarchaeobius chitinivorans]